MKSNTKAERREFFAATQINKSKGFNGDRFELKSHSLQSIHICTTILQTAFKIKIMEKTEKNSRTSSTRKQLEKEVLNAYNALRRISDKSPMEAYESVAASLRLKSWQVQYIVIKARKTGKEVI